MAVLYGCNIRFAPGQFAASALGLCKMVTADPSGIMVPHTIKGSRRKKFCYAKQMPLFARTPLLSEEAHLATNLIQRGGVRTCKLYSFFHIGSRTATTKMSLSSTSVVTALPVTNGGFATIDHSFQRVADCGKVFSTNPKTRLGVIRKMGSPMLLGSILYFFW